MTKIKKLGLIGFPLSHSFSKKYFSEKFVQQGISGFQYELFELENIENFNALLSKNPDIVGLNVTIPHKQKIISYLDETDGIAQRIGAVNVICVLSNGAKIGYNSDYFGFKISLENWLTVHQKPIKNLKALVLGTGGASRAVQVALEDLEIPFQVVSRTNAEKNPQWIVYEQVKSLESTHLVINTTPLGMSPDEKSFPDLPYQTLSKEHFVYDLVYNPSQTVFLQKASTQQAHTKNGLEMLYLQAEKAWEIWQNSL